MWEGWCTTEYAQSFSPLDSWDRELGYHSTGGTDGYCCINHEQFWKFADVARIGGNGKPEHEMTS
jgi:hypothetical protein